MKGPSGRITAWLIAYQLDCSTVKRSLMLRLAVVLLAAAQVQPAVAAVLCASAARPASACEGMEPTPAPSSVVSQADQQTGDCESMAGCALRAPSPAPVNPWKGARTAEDRGIVSGPITEPQDPYLVQLPRPPQA